LATSLRFFPGHLRQRVPDLLNEATLDLRLGIHGPEGPCHLTGYCHSHEPFCYEE